VPLTTRRKSQHSYPAEFAEAVTLAERLEGCMAADKVRLAIAEVHKLGGSSHQVQAVLRSDLELLGFQNEKKGLFAEMAVAALRPDFYRAIGRSGIIAEVERGKTINNNMDLLDLWKCHICPIAHFLFLIVPEARPSEGGTVVKAYDQAVRRQGRSSSLPTTSTWRRYSSSAIDRRVGNVTLKPSGTKPLLVVAPPPL
jgi:hypothetical protein